MNTDFKKSFLNDIKKIKDQELKEKIKQMILCVENAQTLQVIPGLKKLKGYKRNIYYRITIDSHRMGVTIEDNLVTFVVFRPRKDIYKLFP